MKPRLYPENETNFESNGLGPLSDALACTVEENRNGAFELSMEYPVTGVLFEELKHGSIIFAPPNDSSEPQPFRVYGKSTPLSGVVTVRAKHISYQLSHIPVSPFTAGSCAAALQGLKTNAVEPCPFDFWTDKETVATFTVKEPASARSLLGGVAGSVLDVYGGEYEFDRYTVKLHKARGTDSGVVIAYGKNLVDIDQEESIENTITGVYPYYKDTDGNVLELPEKVISSASAQNFPYPRTVPLDCSQEWQETPSVEQLRAYASAYVEKEGIGVPAVSLKVSFVPLWQTEEYKAIAPAERLNLCDIATVRFEKLGVNARAKVVQTVYDVLAGRYESVTLGEASTNLADTIVAQDKAINAKADTSDLEAAAANASAWITGNKGGYVVLRRNADGQPYVYASRRPRRRGNPGKHCSGFFRLVEVRRSMGRPGESPDCRGAPGRNGRFYGRNHGGLTHMSKYYTTARLLYRLHKITADQVWAYTESDPPKITEDEALAICGPRAKDETTGS